MENNLETDYIQRCLELAEVKFDRGASSGWNSYDFEKLSEAIQEATGVVLSVTTLKRLWGKLSYTNTPAITTLNTLAQYAGYPDWGMFKRKVSAGDAVMQASLTKQAAIPGTPGPEAINGLPEQLLPGSEPAGILTVNHEETFTGKPAATTGPGTDHGRSAAGAGETGSAAPRTRKWPYWALGLLSFSIVLYVTLLSNGRSKSSADPTAYQFSSNKTVFAGVPNSVIFKYDASAAGEDSVYISQSWDVRRKFAVPRDKKEYSSIYYRPGYFRAKLIVGKQIVKEHDLMIGSNGWLALVDQDEASMPVYFTRKEFLKGHTVEVDKTTLEAYNIPLQPTVPSVRFYHVQDMGDLRTDNFSFETTVRSNFNQGSAACQRIKILILCKNDVFVIPLCAKGCVGDLALYAGGKSLNSKDTDLSKFGQDLSQWVQLRVEAKDRQIRIQVDGQDACAFPAENQPSDIVGVQYQFEGPGGVKDARFTKGSKVITL
jgi:hypothetical protein